VLVLGAVTVLLLESAGFDQRVAAGSIAVLTADVFASWFLIARASRGSPRRVTGPRPPRHSGLSRGS